MPNKDRRLLQKRKLLTPEQYRICRQKGTEPAFSGQFCNLYNKGTYEYVCCGQEIFKSDAKYDSGTGWPSFSAPASEDAIVTCEDLSMGLKRTEVLCSSCGAHLGHVFEDEKDASKPSPTGQRYCINSLALEFKSEEG